MLKIQSVHETALDIKVRLIFLFFFFSSPQNGSVPLFHLEITERELAGLVISSMAVRDLVRKAKLYKRAKLAITPSETLADVRIFNPFKLPLQNVRH